MKSSANQSLERIAAGGRISRLPTSWAAAIAHFGHYLTGLLIGLNVLRAGVVLIACCLGWFFAAQLRTMRPSLHFELFWAELGFACAIAVPLGLLSAIGLRWRIKGLLVVSIIGVSVLSAEFYAATEEFVFVR